MIGLISNIEIERTHDTKTLLCLPNLQIYAKTNLELIKITDTGAIYKDKSEIEITGMIPIESQKIFSIGDVIGYCIGVTLEIKGDEKVIEDI